jgi:hypothetical protein
MFNVPFYCIGNVTESVMKGMLKSEVLEDLNQVLFLGFAAFLRSEVGVQLYLAS